MIGGSSDLSGTGGAILVIGLFVALFGAGALLFNRE
jgi:hypothetical protein